MGFAWYRYTQQYECYSIFSGLYRPVTISRLGHVQCLSHDGTNCVWADNYDQCLKEVTAITDNQAIIANNLSCGKDHENKWGATGYHDQTHWCWQTALRLYRKRTY